MPQVSVGRPRTRGPALVLLLGVVLTLMTHLVACAAHATEEHRPTATQARYGTESLPLAPAEPPACSVTGAADEQPDNDVLCCDPAHTLAYLRTPVGTALLALLLVVFVSLRHRPEGAASSGAPPGHAETPERRARAGSALLRVVCISRT
ncbi:hypothetical protein ACIPSA_44870 [Streptomyces sp. NPDC086549]|uniref:hypothetical protein n=1 Tax=Streptomyces sp. NPDC086549 TaxID=3365752 RepID=UPI003813E4AC